MNTPIELKAAPKTFTFDAWQPTVEREESYRKRTVEDFRMFLDELVEAAGGTPAPTDDEENGEWTK